MRYAMILLIGLLIFGPRLSAQPLPRGDERTVEQRVAGLESEVQRLESSLKKTSAFAGLVPVFFGIFCALWAQNTRRSAVLWFFLGLVFMIIAGFVVLIKNEGDRRRRQLRRFSADRPQQSRPTET
jgi:hypothetical protein